MTLIKLLIAKYMGYEPVLPNNVAFRVPKYPRYLSDGTKSVAYFTDELPFDSDWNLLFDVVNKIHSEDQYASIIITKNGCSVSSPTLNYTIIGDMRASTYAVVSQYITHLNNYHNERKQ